MFANNQLNTEQLTKFVKTASVDCVSNNYQLVPVNLAKSASQTDRQTDRQTDTTDRQTDRQPARYPTHVLHSTNQDNFSKYTNFNCRIHLIISILTLGSYFTTIDNSLALKGAITPGARHINNETIADNGTKPRTSRDTKQDPEQDNTNASKEHTRHTGDGIEVTHRPWNKGGSTI